MSKVTTPAGLTYVKDFSFPAAQGFTGSAGAHQVRGYQRGGAVKKAPVKKAKGGTTMRDGRDLHSKLYDSGLEMGFKRGGQVKKMGMPTTRGPQKTMDTGTQPARKGRNQAEIEAGGTKKMLPGYAAGGVAGALGKAAKAGVHQICSKSGYKKSGPGAKKRGTAVRKARGGSVKK